MNGPRAVVWNLREKKGKIVSNGMYFIRIRAGSEPPVILKLLVGR